MITGGGDIHADDRATTSRHSPEALREQSQVILTSWGFPDEPASVTADVLGYADLAGIDSHGISIFMTCEKVYAAGRFNLAATPTVLRRIPGVTLLDAQHGLGHPVGAAGMRQAIDNARRTRIGRCSVLGSHHFGAAGYYAPLAADEGLVGIATTSARSAVVIPTGGAEPRLPTNPIAFAAPAGRHDAFALDMSTSTVAINRIKVHDLAGRALTVDWFQDAQGDPVTDATLALDAAWNGGGGGITPLGGTTLTGGHKGYGLALMVQILSSALSCGAFPPTRPPDAPHDIGHFFLAVDPEATRPGGGFLDTVDEPVDAMHATRPAPGEEVLVAGEPEARTRPERARIGIPVSPQLHGRLADICERTGAQILLDA